MLLTLVFVVWTVGRNEQTIANGRDAFVELRLVDPLSLVQGYYMALNMQVDLPPREASASPMHGLSLPSMIGASRPPPLAYVGKAANRARAVQADLRPRSHPPGREGWSASVRQAGQLSVRRRQAETYEDARYGHFRVLADGRSVLIGLTDGDLQPLVPIKRRIEAADSTPVNRHGTRAVSRRINGTSRVSASNKPGPCRKTPGPRGFKVSSSIECLYPGLRGRNTGT